MGTKINNTDKMVYGRILFNNIREYTPLWFRTINHSRTYQRPMGRQPFRGPAIERKSAGAFRFFATWIQKNTAAYQLWILFVAYTMTNVFWQPLLFLYRSNNTHRSLDAAMVVEKAYKDSLPSEDDEEGEEEEEE